MKQKIALKIILLISIAGIMFSGYLSYYELAKKTCPVGGCSSLLGIPTCVYGLTMYAIIFVATIIGLKAKD